MTVPVVSHLARVTYATSELHVW